VRSLGLHPNLNMFASGSTDNIKLWKLPNGEFMQNLSGQNTMINSLAINEDGVLISGGPLSPSPIHLSPNLQVTSAR
jgi:pleiotropic regulator 1